MRQAKMPFSSNAAVYFVAFSPGRSRTPTLGVLCAAVPTPTLNRFSLVAGDENTALFPASCRSCVPLCFSIGFFFRRLVRNMEKLHREFAFVSNCYGYKCFFFARVRYVSAARHIARCLTSVASISGSPITIKQAQINFICCLNIAFPVSRAFLSCAMGFYCIAYLMKSARCMQRRKKKLWRHVGRGPERCDRA